MAPLVAPLAEAQLGGAQAFVTDLARALSARGHEVTVYCPAGSRLDGLRLVEIPTPDLSAARVRPAALSSPELPEVRDAFARCFELVERARPDVVSQHAFDAEAIEEAARVSARVIHTLHLPPVSPRVVEAARATADSLLTVSRACAESWAREGVRAAVVANGVPDFDPGRPPVEPWAMIAGRVSPEKGTHLAVELALAAGLRPRVFGNVYDEAYADRHGIRTEGSLPRGELWRLMARCAVTLMPVAWDEPFGLVAAESQVAGTPVVAHRRGGLPEVVVEGVSGFLVASGDTAGFLEAIGRALRFDRSAVRASARSRLLIDRAAAEYERMLGA